MSAVSKAMDKFRMTSEDKDRFFEFLDTLPENERAVYVFSGSKSSAWQQLGGGSSHMIGMFFKDRLVLSTRGMVKVSTEKGRQERPLDDIADIDVRPGPMFSSVTLRFRDGKKTKIGNIDNAVAQPLTRFMTDGLAAFDRSGLDLKTFNAMFYSYVLSGLPLPEFLQRKGRPAA